jgi:hypothetical protein
MAIYELECGDSPGSDARAAQTEIGRWPTEV